MWKVYFEIKKKLELILMIFSVFLYNEENKC